MTAVLASAVLLFANYSGMGLSGEVQLSIGRMQSGHVFDIAAPIEIPVNANSDRILWSLTDFDGVEVKSGTTPISSGHGTIVFASPGPGYFELVLHTPITGKAQQEVRTSFIVTAAPKTKGGNRRFGVMTHFAQGWESDLVPLIARAGIPNVRDEQYWNDVEAEPGTYRFPERFIRYMAELAREDLEPLIILSFANHLYDGGLTPFSAHGREGYARYGRAVLDRYGSQIHAVEIWNEFNGSFCAGPCQGDRPTSYAQLLESTYRMVKSSHPDVTVVGGVTANLPLPYLEALFQKGALDFMDVLSVHPYSSSPQDVEKEISDLRDLAARYGHPKLPIWVTEFGQGAPSPAGRREAARYLVKMCTALLAAGVDRLYWYLLRDYREFNGMGLLRAPESELGRYAPAPAYAAYANLIHQLGDARFVRREGDVGAPVYLFSRHGEEVRVAWSNDTQSKLRLDSDERIAVFDVVGRQMMTIEKPGGGTLVLDSSPMYIVGNLRRMTEIGAGAPIADSVADYSDQQGKAGWSYGYATGAGGADSTPYDFQEMVPIANPWHREWGQPRYPWLSIGPRDAHPSQSEGRPIWAIRRWTSSINQSTRISGSIIRSAQQGDGITAHIAVDGRYIFSAFLGGASSINAINFDVTADLRLGSKVDFIVTPGPHSDIDFDSTSFEIRIFKVTP